MPSGLKNGGPLPKSRAPAPVRGSIHVEYKRCGRWNCRCVRGDLHGPYYYLHTRLEGPQSKRYVRAGAIRRTRAGIAEWKRRHPPAWTTRQLLADLRRLCQAMSL